MLLWEQLEQLIVLSVLESLLVWYIAASSV